MKGVAILILFAAVAAAESEEHVQELVRCSDDPETLQQHTNCDQFYRCVGGNQVVQSCPALLLFNTEKSICDWRHNVHCNGRILPGDRPDHEFDPSHTSQICANEESGALFAHEHCNKFYVCNQIGQASVVRCPDNLFYNPEEKQCDWPVNVQCGDRIAETSSRDQSYTSACLSEESEGLPTAHENCNQFYKCDAGRAVPFNCPHGLVFNIETLYCDWPFNVECGRRPIVEIKEDSTEVDENDGSWTPVHGHSDPSQAPAICAAEGSDSVLIAHENCDQFYKCYLGSPMVMDCPEYLFYNPEREYCDWPQNVNCGNRKH